MKIYSVLHYNCAQLYHPACGRVTVANPGLYYKTETSSQSQVVRYGGGRRMLCTVGERVLIIKVKPSTWSLNSHTCLEHYTKT